METPNSKIQAPEKIQDQSSKLSLWWAVGRRKFKNGSTYPIRVSFGEAVSEEYVRYRCEALAKQRDSDFKGFKFFDVWPVDGKA